MGKLEKRLPHIFGSDAADAAEEEAEAHANDAEAGSEQDGVEVNEEGVHPKALEHAKAFAKHHADGNHAGMVKAMHGMMKYGKGNLEK
jgi:uncharacterized protein YceH (UPF0502 family)